MDTNFDTIDTTLPDTYATDLSSLDTYNSSSLHETGSMFDNSIEHLQRSGDINVEEQSHRGFTSQKAFEDATGHTVGDTVTFTNKLGDTVTGTYEDRYSWGNAPGEESILVKRNDDGTKEWVKIGDVG